MNAFEWITIFEWTARPLALPYFIYPAVNVYIAMENGPFIVDLPIKDGDFP